MIYLGYFSEMKLYKDTGSVNSHIVPNVDYDKSKVIEYLSKQKKIAVCPRPAIDCVTGDKISDSFSVYTDGEYEWCDFLLHHISKYNIELPKTFIERVC